MVLNYSSLMMKLLYLTPMPYFLAALVDNKSLYIIKDIIILGIFILLFFRPYPKIIYAVISVFMAINIYALSFSYNDILFYILSVREFLFYPLFGILLGYYLSKCDRFEEYFFNFLMITFSLTVLYLVLFPYDSFGSTLRLKSFWDREHEPAIIAGVMFIWTMYSDKSKKFKAIVLPLSIVVMLLSASRSVLLGVFVVFFLINIRKLNVFKLTLMVLIFFMGFTFFSQLSISERGLDHNLGARTSQYSLALSNFENNNFLGLGTDKYGVVGNIKKQYCYQGHCTTTMDSTLIKYSINYGLIFLIPFIVFLGLLLLYYIYLKTDLNKKIFGTIVFGLIIGALTGKLGAYPLNIIFYMTIGIFIYHLNLVNINRKRNNEKNTIYS